MSLYKQGLVAEYHSVLPEQAQYTFDRFGRLTSGYYNIRKGESRFYGRGITGSVVGANTPGPLGTVVDGVVNLILDVAHVLIIVAGIYALGQAFIA